MSESTVDPVEATPFAVRDCALISLATGLKAQNLREFSDILQRVPLESIEHHLWGRLLQPRFDEPEYNNDFASWAYHGLHDKTLAERLSMVVPTDFADQEALRQELVEVLEERLDQCEMVPWAKKDQQFHFLRSQIVVFDSGLRFSRPVDLIPYLAHLSTGSVYYHFIDARNRTTDRCDDFSAWLAGCGPAYQPLRERLCGVDPYFSSLQNLRQIVSALFQSFFEEAAQ
ncbi:MAG: DUF5752 family protein [Desulfuromonadaceae bacterium]|nr:DUF5752 family protein [Desulfuromonadaceae bacterium]